MTIDRDRQIKIPIWLVSILLPIIIAGIVSYGVFSANHQELKIKTEQNSKSIDQIQINKVDRNEINMILIQLNRIEGKLDAHIAQPNTK